MKVSIEWLRDYVDLPPDLTPERIMHDLTLSTVEVEGVEYPGRALAGLVVGAVTAVEPVPGTHLHRVMVDAGAQGQRQVVCGAANVHVGMRSVLALPGATIAPKGAGATLKVDVVEMRGLRSEGVLCAADEVGLEAVFPVSGERGIIDLVDVVASPGDDLAGVIGFDDAVLEIDNKSLTNRPDLWGHVGLAREFAAIYGLVLKPQPQSGNLPERTDLLGSPDAALCNRFTATVFENVEVTAAPLWMRSRLARVGQRSIDLWVDLTNYVMFATGQPSHAYDQAELSFPLTVRSGRAGEVLELLDGSAPDVNGLPCIADGTDVLAAAGVMGGARSGVSDTTRTIYLEMASFDATVVRRSSQRLGLRTEASARFEKAVDSQRIDLGLAHMVDLVRKIQPQARVTGHQDVVNKPTQRTSLTVDLSFIEARLGKRFEASAVTRSLTSLGFDCREAGDSLHLTAPTWRSTGDISLPADIVEEVARLHGYDNFAFVPPRIDLQRLPRARRLPLDRRLREQLAATGLQEVFTYPWTDEALLPITVAPDDLFELSAPPSPAQRFLRPELVPGLLEVVARNQHLEEAFGVFEVGAIFPGRREARSLAAALIGDDPQSLFARAKGVLESLVRNLHLHPIQLRVGRHGQGWYDEHAVLTVVTSSGEEVGLLGRVNARARRATGIKRGDVVALELRVDRLHEYATRENRYTPLPIYPETGFDLTFVLADSVLWQSVYEALSPVDPTVRAVHWLGEYRGKGIEAGHRALSLRVTLGRSDRTLTAEEAESVRQTVINRVRADFAGVQR
ncbi:MAG: phenylalanine--tRNA ligase subunit beta [Pseudomonadales bacterium]